MSRKDAEIELKFSEIVRIGDCTLHVNSGELRDRVGNSVALRSQSSEVLVRLAKDAGKVVSKEEIIQTVWPETFVTDDSLTQCIADIRRAIGDTNHTVVQTLPKKGYKLIATPVDGPAEANADRPMSNGSHFQLTRHRLSWIGLFGLAIVIASLALWRSGYLADTATPDRPSIAVLPFDDFSAGKDKGYLSNAIAEGIITELSRSRLYSVTARNSSFRYRGRDTDVRQIGKELGVHYVLEGSQQKSGEKLRVTAQLIDANSGKHVWAHTYDRTIGDLFTVQDAIVRTLADRVGERIARPIPSSNINKVSALHYFLTARNLIISDFTEANNYKAYELSQKAIEADPNSHHGYLGMVFVHRHAGEYGWHGWDRQEAYDKGLDYGKKALDIDPDDPGVHYLLARLRASRGEFADALAHFDKAISLNPSSSRYLASSATPLLYTGRTDEAIERLERAKGIDPFHTDNIHWQMGWALWEKNDCQGALDAMMKMKKIYKGAHRMLAGIYACLGNVEKAQEAYQIFYADAHEPTISELRADRKDIWTAPGSLERWLDHMRIAGMKE